MRRIVLLIIQLFLITSISHTQSFFREITEVQLSEEVDQLLNLIEKSEGNEKKVAKAYHIYFHTDEMYISPNESFEGLNKDESLSMLWLKIHDLRHRFKYYEAVTICDSILKEGDNYSKFVQAEFLRFRGVTFSMWGDFLLALKDLTEAEKLFTESESEFCQLLTRYYLINNYVSYGHIEEFNKTLNSTISKYEDRIVKYPYLHGNFNTMKASRSFLEEDYIGALKHTSNNVQLYKKLGDNVNISRSSYNTAIASLYCNLPDSAIRYLKISKSYSFDGAHPKTKAKMLISLLEFLSKDEFKNLTLRLYGFRNMEEYFSSIDVYFEENTDRELQLHYLQQKEKYYEAVGDKNALLEVVKEQNEHYSDLIAQDTSSSELLLYKQELEKAKEQENAYLSEIDEKNRKNKKAEKSYRFLWIIGSILLFLLILVIIFLRLRHHKKTKQTLRLKEDETIKRTHAENELENVKAELNRFRLKLIEKTDTIDKLMENQSEERSEQDSIYEQMSEMKILTEEDWEEFKSLFKRAHPNMNKVLESNQIDLTDGELRILMLLKLEFSRNQMSNILGIGKESIRKAHYRLKKKIEPVEIDHILANIK